MKNSVSRRGLLSAAGVSVAAAGLPELALAHKLAAPRADVLRLALVGCGSQAGGDVPAIASHPGVKIRAVCDPDARNRNAFGERYGVPESARFADYRPLLAALWNDLDAVFVATPDHMHAPVGLAALAHGLHLYIQKPLARSVTECRALGRAAAKLPQLATQMGVQIHADAAYRTAVAWLRAGVVGPVREIHSFCGKGWGGALPTKPAEPVPDHLDWELYCGIAEKMPYVSGYYHPGNWRKWQAFGTGTLGDMGCHILDPVFTGTGLTAPLSVVSHLEAPPTPQHYPYNAHVEWTMAGTSATTARVRLHWYHGDTRPPADVLPGGAPVPGTGSVVIGEKGRMLIPHWAIPSVWDAAGAKREAAALPAVERSADHYHEWVDVALGRRSGPCGAHIVYAAALTETVLLGNAAAWWPGKTLFWDAAACRFTGDGAEAANARLLAPLRSGWSVPFLNA